MPSETTIPCQFMVRLIALLEEELALRGRPARQDLARALQALEQEAIAAGVDAGTVKAIHAAQSVAAWHRLPPLAHSPVRDS